VTRHRGTGKAHPQSSDTLPADDNGDGLEALKELVRDRHQVFLGRDDPIMMLQTVNELLVAQTAAALEQAQIAALTKFCQELEISTASWARQAKELSERTLEAARRVSTEEIERTKLSMIETLALERERIVAATRRATKLNIIALIVTALSVLGSRWLH